MADAPPIDVGSYRSDFFIVENIIGYTGNIHDNPTVYFMSSIEFGRITQSHDIAWNIGREPVAERFPDADTYYKISNEVKNGVEVAVEKYMLRSTGEVLLPLHTSRNPFIDTRRKGMKTYALLSQAIWRFKSVKRGDPSVNRRR
jgi:hypothetical protein